MSDDLDPHADNLPAPTQLHTHPSLPPSLPPYLRHDLGPLNEEEKGPRLIGHGAGNQGLTRPGGAIEEDTCEGGREGGREGQVSEMERSTAKASAALL